VIDLRTDALSRPTDEMWAAMRAAEVGWAYVGEDASVNELEARGARLLGKEAAILLPTCSTANLVALLTLGTPGQAVALDPTCHVATSEGNGFEQVAGLRAFPVETRAGCPDAEAVERAILEAKRAGLGTSLLVLENSHNNAGGAAVTPERAAAAAAAAHRLGAAVHLDGARLCNSAVALGVTPGALTAGADTVALSLGKGLCAPGGALLAGSTPLIARARAKARLIGAGSLHKAGPLAAAGLVAIGGMVERLAEDNRRARGLAEGLAPLGGLRVDLAGVQTNIVVIDTAAAAVDALLQRMAGRGVLGFRRSDSRFRFVTHRLIGDAEVARAVAAVAASL
jgi:threonine aldolase